MIHVSLNEPRVGHHVDVKLKNHTRPAWSKTIYYRI